MVTISKDIQDGHSLVILATPSCDLMHYGLTDEETGYIRARLAARDTRISINKNNYWIFIQIVDPVRNDYKEMENMRRSASKMHRWIVQQGIRSITVIDTENKPRLAYAYAEGLVLTNYQFLKYLKNKDEKRYSLDQISIMGLSVYQQDIDDLNYVSEAVYKARDLVNEPSNYLTSVQLGKEVEEMGKAAGFEVEVYNKSRIEELKMGGILSVNKGSVEEPTFSILTWHPQNARNEKPVILVGKGLVYDTGGLSLKPANSMDTMKCDMAGGAAVASTLYAIAKAKLPVYVIGMIPSTDNRLGPASYSPGDIITMYDGTTVEVLNADAEGRLILADALSYARQYDPGLVIDLATLTGAAQRAIGSQGMVGMGNAPRDVMDALIECGEAVFERIAEFPFWDEYAEAIKSDIADLKNIGGDEAGAITAGKFLEHFTGYPYIHLDIAGLAFPKSTDHYRIKGGTGTGVRILFEFLKKY